MRVVVSAAYGTWGDVQPMLALAAALAEQGHAVTCIVDGYWLDAASATRGVTVVTLGAADEYAAMLADAKLRWSKPQTLVHAWLSRLRQHYEARRQRRGVHLRMLATLLAEAPKQTVFVGHSLDLAVKLIEEKKGVPCATVVLQPWMLRSKNSGTSFKGMHVRAWYPRWLKSTCFKLQDALIDFAYAPQLNAVRHVLGLPPASRVYHRFFLCKALVLGLFPPWLANESDWVPQLKLLDFPLADAAAGGSAADAAAAGGSAADAAAALEQLPPALRAFVEAAQRDAAPLVVVTLGSAPPPYAAAVFSAAVEACATLRARAVLLCNVAGVVPQPLPAHAHHAEYVPFRALLQHAAVFCYNGGIGGMSQALRAGVPQLIVPGRFDQPDNAERMKLLGVGARLDVQQFTAARCAAALQTLRTSSAVRSACAAAAARFCDGAAQPSCADRAAALIAALGGADAAATQPPAEQQGDAAAAVTAAPPVASV